MIKKNVGGERLGSGAKMNVEMHGYQRSNHDLSYLWKSTISAGTLVPFMVIPGLPGDTFDIDLDTVIRTHPTIGPLFGSFKVQLDVFQCPIRLYNSLLHNNTLNIGMDISKVKFPLMELRGENLQVANTDVPIEFQQINQSSLFAYLGIRGLAAESTNGEDPIMRTVNAIPYLAFWDIFKNYYANKQEDNAYVIHADAPTVQSATYGLQALPQNLAEWGTLEVTGINITKDNLEVQLGLYWYKLTDIFDPQYIDTYTTAGLYEPGQVVRAHHALYHVGESLAAVRIAPSANYSDIKPKLVSFPLENIDAMRTAILQANTATPYIINELSIAPYGLPIAAINEANPLKMNAICGQEGLPVKTYQSDLFNNWIQTEWIDGENGINAITAISTAGGSFTLDTLNLSKKVYDMLNRIAISGGSYEDYIETVYDHSSKWRAETPIYCGGLSKEIVFQEVVSNAATEGEPLGTLAGKGVMTSKHKGGKLIVNVDEPSYLIGIISLTPRIDYCQGNNWDINLKTLSDLHKPALDGIGYQDLVTDQMSFADTKTQIDGNCTFKSAGKQPAWLNYMTNYNKTYGNFADPRSQMFMTLPRRYEITVFGIQDLTTYIDPAKFNFAFAQTDLSSMNFWAQIAANITARRKISAKIIPNL